MVGIVVVVVMYGVVFVVVDGVCLFFMVCLRTVGCRCVAGGGECCLVSCTC